MVAGLEEGLEYQCPECGTYFPASTVRCPICRTEFKEEEETVEEIIEEAVLPLKGDVKEAEEDQEISVEETMGPPEKDFNMKHRTSKRGSKKVIYKKVRDKSP